MQSDCPAFFFVSAIEHNERLRFAGRPRTGTTMARSDHHSDFDAELDLLCAASIALLLFAWAVAAYSRPLADLASSL